MAKGVPVAKEGDLIANGITSPAPGLRDRPFKIGPITAEIYRVKKHAARETVPVISIVNQTVTTVEEVKISCPGGYYRPDGDILIITLMTREGDKIGKGFVKGFCPELGAIASSVAHETHGLMVLGQNEEEMAMAADDVLKMSGGISLVHGGEVRARMPLTIGGICSTKSIPDLAHEIRTFHGVLKNLGCTLEYPLWTLGFLSFTSVLSVRITYNGVFDINKYRQSFGNPNMPWIQIEDIYRQRLPFVKLQNIITSSARVSNSEIEDEFKRENQTVKVEYLEIPFSKFNNSELEISEEEIEQYYNEHIEKLNWHAIVLIFYSKPEGKIKISEDEVKEYRWFTEKEIKELKLAFGHEKIIEDYFYDKNNDKITIDEIAFLSEEERRKILLEFNNNNAEFSRDKTIYQFVEKYAETAPDRIAPVSLTFWSLALMR